LVVQSAWNGGGEPNAGGFSHVLVWRSPLTTIHHQEMGEFMFIGRRYIEQLCWIIVPSINILSERIPTPVALYTTSTNSDDSLDFPPTTTIYTDLIWGMTPPPRERRMETPPNTAVKIVLTKYVAKPEN
jgi:hypothetical protein